MGGREGVGMGSLNLRVSSVMVTSPAGVGRRCSLCTTLP